MTLAEIPRNVAVDELVSAMRKCEAYHPIENYVLPRDLALIADAWALACYFKASHIDLNRAPETVRDAILRWI